MTFAMGITILMFVFVAFALLTNKIPGSVACGIAAMVLWIAGVLSDEQVFVNFISSSIVSMIGMMIITGALIKTDILPGIAGMIRKSKGGHFIILLVTMMVAYFLCQFIGGVTAMITVIPLAMVLAEEAGMAPTLVVLPASVGAQAGLLALPIGGAAVMYQMKNQILANVGIADQQVGFWDLCLGRLPGTIAVFAFILIYGWKLLPQRGLAESDLLSGSQKVLAKSSLPQWKQNVIYAIFIAELVLMSISRQIGLNSMLITTTGALLVILLGFLKEREAYNGNVNWSLIFMMGFMLSLGTALTNSGAGEKLANLLQPVYGTGSCIVAVTATFIFCVILTQFMDNMSLVNILTPICAVAAARNGIPVVPIVIAIDASCVVSFSTPMASPSSLLAYQLGGYSMKEMLKFNIPLIILSTIVSIIWIPIYANIIL